MARAPANTDAPSTGPAAPGGPRPRGGQSSQKGAEFQQLGNDLVHWFQRAARSLPWREGRTAYRVWLSEVMLQQTQVSRVVDYFQRFVDRFPTVEALAAASEDEVLSMWSGLGYYSRGRNLHRAARAVVEVHGGTFPSTSTTLQSLPGVGAYTSAAIASLAFGEPVAVVDGNVLRVLSRLTDEPEAVNLPATHERLRLVAQGLVDAVVADGGAVGPVNEGLMELGALVCTPTSPACLVCPWQGACAARRAGTVSSRPVKIKAKARKAVRLVALVIVDDDGQVWLERRVSRGLFGGLWQPPCVEVDDAADAEVVARGALLERGWAVEALPEVTVVERTLTHRELRFEVMAFRAPPAPPSPLARADADTARWQSVAALDEVGMASAARAVLEAGLSSSTSSLVSALSPVVVDAGPARTSRRRPPR